MPGRIAAAGGADGATLRAVRYAQGIARDVTCVHVTDEPAAADELRRAWDAAHMRPTLVIIESPYRELVGPLTNYIEQFQKE